MSTDFEGFVVRGLLSVWLSRGPENITAEIDAKWPGSVQVSDHGNALAWFSNVQWLYDQCVDIKLKKKKKLVLVGHSFGGTAILMVAQALSKSNIAVDLLCPIDPAFQYTTAVPTNVKRVVAFHQNVPGQLGRGVIVPSKSWTKQEWDERAVDYLRHETHLQIVNDPFVHQTILTEIAKLESKAK